MQYRLLGKTGMHVSVIGLGCAQLGSCHTDYGVHLVQRAVELGINYFDVAYSYRDAEVKVGLGLQGQRDHVFISTKTPSKTRDAAWRDIEASLQRLQTDYLDNCHLHGLDKPEDLAQRMGPGGALEALLEARDQRVVRHIGCSAHTAEAAMRALERFDLDVILVPMNLIERDPLAQLIPLCQERQVGVTIMKPVATGLLPAPLALKWLLNQPIATAVPGTTTLAELEENAAVGHLDDLTLTPAEQASVESLRAAWEHVRCRVCHRCLPCPQEIPIGIVLGTDVMYDHFRTMGPEGFRTFAWSQAAIEGDLQAREARIAAIESCTRCGDCEARCPYGLPIIDMLRRVVSPMREMVHIYREWLGHAPA